MWLLTPTGFVSIVQHRNDVNNVIVRARVLLDLQRFNQRNVRDTGQIERTPDADYPYRLSVSKGALRAALDVAVQDLTYANFKSAAQEADPSELRNDVYHNVWSELRRLEALNAQPGGLRALSVSR